MKTAIAYFLKVLIFEDLLILNALYQKYKANITCKQFIKWCFTHWFYNFMWKMGKRKKKMITVWVKKTEEKRDICRWKSQGELFD